MPAKSPAQLRFMQMMAKKNKIKGPGPSPEVAKKFLSHKKEDKKKK